MLDLAGGEEGAAATLFCKTPTWKLLLHSQSEVEVSARWTLRTREEGVDADDGVEAEAGAKEATGGGEAEERAADESVERKDGEKEDGESNLWETGKS